MGLPRVVRLNVTHFVVCMIGDKKQLKQIYDHFRNTVEEEEFVAIYKYATSEPYGFLYTDTNPKEESMHFRKGFNESIKLKNKSMMYLMKKWVSVLRRDSDLAILSSTYI